MDSTHHSTDPGRFEVEKLNPTLTRLTDILPARWQISLDAWNDLVTLKPHLRTPRAWLQHFCTTTYNLNIDIQLDKLFIGPAGSGEKALGRDQDARTDDKIDVCV